MANRDEVEIGKRFRVTRRFREEWISDHSRFDESLDAPIEVREGIEGVIHSLNSPDGFHLGYVDAHFPSLRSMEDSKGGGTRVQTPIEYIQML